MNRNLPLAEVYFHRRGHFGQAEKKMALVVALVVLPMEVAAIWGAIAFPHFRYVGQGIAVSLLLGVGALYRQLRAKVGELYRLTIDGGALRITPQAGGEATVFAPGSVQALRYGKKAVKDGGKEIGSDTIVEVTTASGTWKLLAQDTDIADLEKQMSDVEKANPAAKVQYVLGV
jgi:hypothetical protein